MENYTLSAISSLDLNRKTSPGKRRKSTGTTNDKADSAGPTNTTMYRMGYEAGFEATAEHPESITNDPIDDTLGDATSGGLFSIKQYKDGYCDGEHDGHNFATPLSRRSRYAPGEGVRCV